MLSYSPQDVGHFDQAVLKVQAGDGGSGNISFFHDVYKPLGESLGGAPNFHAASHLLCLSFYKGVLLRGSTVAGIAAAFLF